MKRLLAVLVAGLLLAACTSSKPTPKDLDDNNGGIFQGAGIVPGEPRPQFTLTDTAGRQFAFGAVTAKQPTLLYFGYTRCPDICPETMANAMIAMKKLPAALARKTWIVFVSTDVKHDTRPVLAKWLSNFSHNPAHWVGLVGTQAQINAAQAAAHVTVAEDGGQTHSAQLLLYGPDDYAHVTFLESTQQQQQIEHDLPLVAAGRT